MKVTCRDIEELELKLVGAKIDYLVERGWRKKPHGAARAREWVEPSDTDCSVETALDEALEMAIDAEWKAGSGKSHHVARTIRHSVSV